MKKNGNGNGKKENGRKLTRHHMLPSSRGEVAEVSNLTTIPKRYHESWHIFFGNLTPQEALQFIKVVFLGEGRRERKRKWTIENLYELQLAIQKQTIIAEKKQKRRMHHD